MSDDQKPSSPENRKFKRSEATFAVVYTIESPFTLRVQIGTREIDGIAKDLSEGGLCLATNYDIPSGAVINMKFKLLNAAALGDQDRSRRFELRGEARYSFYESEKAYRIGIRFLNASEADRDFITRCG